MSPSSRISEGFSIELASAADGPALNAIYNSDEGFTGDIAVKFTREPNPYASLFAEGDDLVVPVIRERATGRLVGMGACVTRTAWVNDQPTRVGYLTGLKVLPEFRGWLPMMPRVYAFLRANTPQVECYYTTILSENRMARKLLEKPRPDMPRYRFVDEYTTHCFRATWGGRGRVERGNRTMLGMCSAEQRFHLSAFRIPPHVRDADIRLLRSRDGELVAWCAVVDRQAVKQYTITSYGGRYARLAKLPVHLAGYPRLPKPGSRANYVSIVGMGARNDDPAWVAELLRGVAAEFRDRDFVMYGVCGADHPYAPALDGLKTFSYSSRLYDVTFDEQCLQLDDHRAIGLDVALL